MKLFLASKSPRRRELLEKAGIPFEVRGVEVDETARPREAAAGYVKRLARDKALVAGRDVPSGSLVLGADTVVVTGGRLLGKPKDEADAARMLSVLSGGTHFVLTGVCVVRAPDEVLAAQYEATTVRFKPMSNVVIQDYVRSGEPLGKAGAYAIQGAAAKFIERVDGNTDNVIGLPVALVRKILAEVEASGPTPGAEQPGQAETTRGQ